MIIILPVGALTGFNCVSPVLLHCNVLMVSVSNLNQSAERFERRASQAGQDYEQGVSEVSDSEQQQATLDAADAWVDGVQESIANGTFQQGVNNPTDSWQSRALEVGRNRFTQGVQGAGDAWQSGFQPAADALESLNLEPRGAAGSEANRSRMNAVFDTLSELDI